MVTVIKTASVCLLLMLLVLQYGKTYRLRSKLNTTRKRLKIANGKLKEFGHIQKEQELADAYSNGYEDASCEHNTYYKRTV